MIAPAKYSIKAPELKQILINMCNMKPYQLGVITEGPCNDDMVGNFVMMTNHCTSDNFEVMNLTQPETGGFCVYDLATNYMVRILKSHELIILHNDTNKTC